VAIEFYDVKIRKKVSLPERDCVKTTFTTKTGQIRYGLRGKTTDGRKLTKFVSKADWEKMNLPKG
jgi:hypothetical protein